MGKLLRESPTRPYRILTLRIGQQEQHPWLFKRQTPARHIQETGYQSRAAESAMPDEIDVRLRKRVGKMWEQRTLRQFHLRQFAIVPLALTKKRLIGNRLA